MAIPPNLNGDPPPMPAELLESYLAEADALADQHGVDVEDAASAILMADENIHPAATWEPDDDSGAEWCGRKRAEAIAAIERSDAQAQEWFDEIARWRETVTKEARATLLLMTTKLERYALARRRAGGSAKLTLPSVEIATTKHSAAVRIDDQALVIAWAKAAEHPELIHTTEKVLVSEVRSYVDPKPIPTGRTALDLACGCSIIDTLPEADSDGNLWAAGASILCPTHRIDVEIVHAEPEMNLAAVDLAGTVVDGMFAEPEHLTARIR